MAIAGMLFKQPQVTQVTCNPVDTLPSGPSSKFRQCSCATAHGGGKHSPIIGNLRYMAKRLSSTNAKGNHPKHLHQAHLFQPSKRQSHKGTELGLIGLIALLSYGNYPYPPSCNPEHLIMQVERTKSIKIVLMHMAYGA